MGMPSIQTSSLTSMASFSSSLDSVGMLYSLARRKTSRQKSTLPAQDTCSFVDVVVLGVLEYLLHSYVVFENLSQVEDSFKSPVKKRAGNRKADEVA